MIITLVQLLVTKIHDHLQIEDYLWKLSGLDKREVPLMFINQVYVGGYDKVMKVAIQVVSTRALVY